MVFVEFDRSEALLSLSPLSSHFSASIQQHGRTVRLGDWLERKKVTAIIIKQQFGFPISTT